MVRRFLGFLKKVDGFGGNGGLEKCGRVMGVEQNGVVAPQDSSWIALGDANRNFHSTQ